MIIMDNKLYVNYLNRPKRAKYNADSEVVLQQTLQSYLWNSCLLFKKDEPKPIPRKLINCGEKSNLSAEMQFGSANMKEKDSKNCGCSYRNQLCQQHVNMNKADSSNHIIVPTKFTSSHPSRRASIWEHFRTSSNNRHLSSDSLHKKVLNHRHPYRYVPYVSKRLSRTVKSHKQNSFNTVFNHDLHCSSKCNQVLEICGRQAKSELVCVDPDILCSCAKVPFPSDEVGYSYFHDCQSFSIRRALALHLLSTLSMKTNKRLSNSLINVPVSLKKVVELWCEFLFNNLPRSSIVCFMHDTKRSQVNGQCNYSFYDKKDSETRFQQIANSRLYFRQNLLCEMCLQSYVDECLLKCGVNQDQKVISHCINSCCYATPLFNNAFKNHENLNLNLSLINNLPEKRISSRLKKKRDSGTQGPYSSDFIVEVPVSKKVKKPKLSHPYSHALFWNFYEIDKSAEKYEWYALAKAYYSRSLQGPFQLADEDKSLDLKSSAQVEDQVLANWRSGNAATCPYCGVSFKTSVDKARLFHLNRHYQLQWDTFRTPQFFPNRWQSKPRPSHDEGGSLGKTRPENLKESPCKQQTGQFRKRPTARKSHGIW